MSRLDCALHASGRGVSLIHFFFIGYLLGICRASGISHEPERLLRDIPQYEVVHPTRVDAGGHFLSNILSHHARRVQRREASEETEVLDRVFYQLWHGGHSLHFNLTLNPNLLAPGFLTERRYGGLDGAKISPAKFSQCYYLGEVSDEGSVRGRAAISTCDGLTGLFKLSGEEFFIQPLEKSSDETSAPQAHAIYKRHASPPSSSPITRPVSGKQDVNGTCGVQNSLQSFSDIERERERWEHRQQRRRKRIRQRSVSKEKWVETLVVADPKMVEHHGSKAVESYVLAVMNIVAGLFSDASIGNAINIVVVRLILLEKEEDELKITHHADNSLNSFCKWQKKLNPKGDEHPLHHDVAVLLTRKDICASINMPCETLGLSHVAGMCQSHRSCSISEDTGLPLAFTVAHELGHNFGIQHDGNGNDCEPIGKRPFVMSPQLLYGTSLPKWSRCSRQYITRFLDRGWGWCLDDPPVKDKLSLDLVLPGVLYSAAHQCRLQYGSGSVLCDDMDNVCSTLWCTVGTTCHSKLDRAVDGTSCGEDKWCISGECVAVGYEPESVNGGWASWSEWSTCSRTCGAGVQSAHRDCDNPVPSHRGKYCLGERRRYRICNTSPCLHEQPSFRSLQCSQFNSMPYKGRFYKWEAVINRVSPCELHCRPLNEDFSEKMRDAVIDGTPCYEGNKSRDMCINGICKNVGCDHVIESSAVEDRCGVCLGNGSTCTTVRRTFEETEGLGYVDIGLIPEGARDIRIEEMAEAGNFLALRSDTPNKYFLNGGWTIQWNGEYKAAGTVFTYERTGQLENLTSPGPTMEPLWIQLLFQETNPGVRYEYTISQNISEENGASVFFWKHGSWTECSVTCGRGVQRQIVHCVEKTTGIVEENLCDPSTRPEDNQTSCKKEPCAALWWSGEWQKCSASCGSSGLTKRTVLCIHSLSAEEQEALQPTACKHLPKPRALSSCNTHIPCPSDWSSSNWSKCSLTCGSGVRRRNITCSRNTGADCDPQKKPLAVASCFIQDCPTEADNFGGIDWSGSGWSSKEVLNEINSIPDVKPPLKYGTTRAQPRNQKELNHVVEGDFHYHNNIENIDQTVENSVQVDDFYYDYNFINFHEDLSDDFESGGKDSEDSSVTGAPPTPTHVNENTHMETTQAPTASTFKNEEPSNTKPNTMKDDGSSATKESVQTESEDSDDFLSEDFLLPVSATHAPPFSSTQQTQTQKESHGILLWPEDTSTMPSPVFPENEPTQDVKGGQFEEDAENNYDSFSEEENPSEEVMLTPQSATGHPTSVGTVVATTVSAYNDNESTLHPPYSANSPTPETVDSSFDIPQTNTQSSVFPAASLDFDPTSPETGHTTSQYSQDLRTTSLPSSDEFTPPYIPSPRTSGNQEASDDSSSITGTDLIPPTNLEGSTRPPPSDFLPAPVKQTPTAPASTERTGTPSPKALSTHSAHEINLPPLMSIGDQTIPPPTREEESQTPAAPIEPTHPPDFWLTSIQPSASTHVITSAYWIASNWSACSTTCGLGAIWRTLTCSTGSNSDCDPAKRPAPAQRCYLRPCSMWKIGDWSKCSKNCDGGFKSREVQCFDMRDDRPLRPFHCRAMSSRPQTQLPCNPQPCLQWYASSWGECSEVCGGGEQQRIVACPEEDQCDRELQPSNIQSCNTQPCAQWLTGSWGQCSASCGGGVQWRLIQCVDTKGETNKEVDAAECDHELQPESTRKCNVQQCEGAPSGTVCLRDRLTLRFCQTLRWLGRCHLPNVQAQCCKTCRQPSHPATSSRR